MISYLFRITITTLMLLSSVTSSLTLFSLKVSASTPDNSTSFFVTTTQTPTANLPLSVNKNFHLSTINKRIIQQNYQAATDIGFNEAEVPVISLRVGASVDANRIDILLHNIHGEVHFQGSANSLIESIRSHRLENPVTQ